MALNPSETDSLDSARPADIASTVAQALAEDIGDGDRNAALVSAEATAEAQITARDTVIIAGCPWVDAVFAQLDETIVLDWHVADGQRVKTDQPICTLSGPTRALLSGERTALNFLQLLSGVASSTREYVDRLAKTGTRIVDTRKTLPGLRSAQKYAVVCGGGANHRFGQFDAFLLKENHIAALGSIAAAVTNARRKEPGLFLQVEVENLDELDQALEASVDGVLLDNFPSHVLARAVNKAKAHRQRFRQDLLIEASGDINMANLREIADTGVDRISIGGLTKHIRAANLSFRLYP